MAGLGVLQLQILFFSLLSVFTQAQTLVVPAPQGKYAVGHNIIKLTDTSRIDPYDPLKAPRNVMISVFYPIRHSHCPSLCPVAYMPPQTAAATDAFVAPYGIPNGTFGALRLEVCCSSDAATSFRTIKDLSKTPVVLFSPGLQGSRLLYSAFVQNLASAGYVVASMDHAFETQIVEYPDGSVVLGFGNEYWDPSIPGRLDALIEVRVADARFVLTQLRRNDVMQKLVPGAKGGFQGKAAMYGHSFGGATSIKAIMDDKRFVGAIDMDGSIWGTLHNTSTPALLFGRAEPSPHNRVNDPSWVEGWGYLKGWKREIGVKEIEHLTFGDVALLVKLAQLEISDSIKAAIGALDPGRSYEVITKVAASFFDFVMTGKKSSVLEGRGQEEFPEVVVNQ